MTEWADRPAYTTGQRVRCARRFRQQLWSPRHPERRIHRIYRCVNWRECKETEVQTQAHHIDYDEPYIVVWVCDSCHRRIEHESLKVKKGWIYNYTSLVIQYKSRHRTGDTVLAHRLRVVKEEVPF